MFIFLALALSLSSPIDVDKVPKGMTPAQYKAVVDFVKTPLQRREAERAYHRWLKGHGPITPDEIVLTFVSSEEDIAREGNVLFTANRTRGCVDAQNRVLLISTKNFTWVYVSPEDYFARKYQPDALKTSCPIH